MRRRSLWRVPALLALAVIVPVVAGCGGGGGGGGVPPSADPGFRILAVEPTSGALGVSPNTVISVTFSQVVRVNEVSEANFMLYERGTNRKVPGVVSMIGANRTAVFDPGEKLLLNAGYKVRLLADITSIESESLKEEFVSYFTTTVSEQPLPPPPVPPPDSALTPVGNMQVGRSSHRATLLSDGTVLITGGFAMSSAATSVGELFDPQTEKFKRTASTMATARAFHTSTKLSDGRVLVAGGLAGTALAESDSAEIYDPASGSFTTLTSRMARRRAFHTATLLGDGRVLIAGGSVPGPSGTFSSKTAEIFDPALGTFTALPDMAVYRAGHTATTLADGAVMMIGGNSTSFGVEAFDGTTDEFTTLAGLLKAPRRSHTATLLEDGHVVVVGGGERTAEIYITDKDYFLWTGGFPLYSRKDHTANITTSGRVLITGGSYTIGSSLIFHASTERYAPRSGAFLGTGLIMSDVRTRHRATTLEDGRILLTGGRNLDPTFLDLSTAEVYEEN